MSQNTALALANQADRAVGGSEGKESRQYADRFGYPRIAEDATKKGGTRKGKGKRNDKGNGSKKVDRAKFRPIVLTNLDAGTVNKFPSQAAAMSFMKRSGIGIGFSTLYKRMKSGEPWKGWTITDADPATPATRAVSPAHDTTGISGLDTLVSIVTNRVFDEKEALDAHPGVRTLPRAPLLP